MPHIAAAGCITEKAVKCRVPPEPKARNCTTFDWQECLAISARESVQFEISCLSEKSLQDVSWADIQITKSRLYWMNSPTAAASFIGGLLIRNWRPPEVSASVLLPSPP